MRIVRQSPVYTWYTRVIRYHWRSAFRIGFFISKGESKLWDGRKWVDCNPEIVIHLGPLDIYILRRTQDGYTEHAA